MQPARVVVDFDGFFRATIRQFLKEKNFSLEEDDNSKLEKVETRGDIIEVEVKANKDCKWFMVRLVMNFDNYKMMLAVRGQEEKLLSVFDDLAKSIACSLGNMLQKWKMPEIDLESKIEEEGCERVFKVDFIR